MYLRNVYVVDAFLKGFMPDNWYFFQRKFLPIFSVAERSYIKINFPYETILQVKESATEKAALTKQKYK